MKIIILKTCYLNITMNFIVTIFAQNNNNINVLSKINFNGKLTISNTEFKDVNLKNIEKILRVL